MNLTERTCSTAFSNFVGDESEERRPCAPPEADMEGVWDGFANWGGFVCEDLFTYVFKRHGYLEKRLEQLHLAKALRAKGFFGAGRRTRPGSSTCVYIYGPCILARVLCNSS